MEILWRLRPRSESGVLEVIGSEPETRVVRVVLSAVQLCGVTFKYMFLTSCHRPVRARTVPCGVRIGCALRLCASDQDAACRRCAPRPPPRSAASRACVSCALAPAGACVWSRERRHRGRDGRQLCRIICEASLAKCHIADVHNGAPQLHKTTISMYHPHRLSIRKAFVGVGTWSMTWSESLILRALP